MDVSLDFIEDDALSNLLKVQLYHRTKRCSWDTHVKHYFRLGLEDGLPENLKKQIPSSNISRWKQEPEDKYKGSGLSNYIKEDIELFQKIGQAKHLKAFNENYLKLIEALHYIVGEVKEVKNRLRNCKDIIVNTIENIKDSIPINDALIKNVKLKQIA